MGRCPKGHILPHRTNLGTCTPVYCAGHLSGVNERSAHVSTKATKDDKFTTMAALGVATRRNRKEVMDILSKEADSVIDTMIPETIPGWEQARATAKAQKGEELVKLSHAIGRWSAMKAFFKVPEGLKGAEAEQFVAEKAMELSVDAVCELERQLKLGDPAERRDALRDILDMTGQRRKESIGSSSPTIILIGQSPNGPVAVPWDRRNNIVEGKYVPPPTKTISADAGVAVPMYARDPSSRGSE